MKARIAMYRGARLDAAFPLTASLTTIGRDAGNLIQLPHPRVSKRHAAIHFQNGAWAVEDLKSTNGVTVNGARVSRIGLKNGDRIRIGSLDLVFETVGDNEEWVPVHVIDFSSDVNQRTMV